ncbi:MAG: Asp-tRNA(Asn)/Glu-tRNA(Gln) amidotransferase subunit GatC [Candidatus Beckwithbacteria bacterium]|nr:Asp-tRNA(Asn)/Glu-tRNA(Gln) amidotransferase subunit GatC [Candidatus Beckwithbacteria bacterium]
MSSISPKLVKHIAKLANLPLSAGQINKFSSQLSNVLDFMGQLSKLKIDPKKASPHLDLTNVTREDKIDTSRILTQKQALSQARKTHQGYFLVKAIFS